MVGAACVSRQTEGKAHAFAIARIGRSWMVILDSAAKWEFPEKVSKGTLIQYPYNSRMLINKDSKIRYP